MRFIMDFSKNLNKLLLIGSVLSGTSIGGTSEVISYHLFQGSPHPQIVVSPSIKAVLSEKLTRCNEEFQSAACTDLEDTAETLIPRLKNIFIGKENKVSTDAINSLEESFYKNEIDISTAAAKIIEKRKGLPEAAYQLACMYDQEGIYSIALLWSKIAYELGIRSGEIFGKQLIFKLKTL